LSSKNLKNKKIGGVIVLKSPIHVTNGNYYVLILILFKQINHTIHVCYEIVTNLTIAGQTAPGNGIDIRTETIPTAENFEDSGASNQVMIRFFDSTNVVLRFVRVRCGISLQTDSDIPNGIQLKGIYCKCK
jgi:hypothetical protein